MRFKTVGNKADIGAVVVKNADTVTIPQGTPVCLNINASDDGLAVVLPSTGGALKNVAVHYGVVITPGGIPVNGIGESQVFGFCNNVILTRQTRAASTAAWAAEASINSFFALQPETVANGYQTVATQAASAFMPYAVLAQSLAAYVSSASSTADSRTAITAGVKAFLRIL